MVLCSVFTCRHFKHKSDAQQSLLSFSVGHHLERTRHYGQDFTVKCRNKQRYKMCTDTHTCRMVKFSSTLFIMYFSGRCLSLWMKLIIYSHMGERWMRNTYFPPSICAYSVWIGKIQTPTSQLHHVILGWLFLEKKQQQKNKQTRGGGGSSSHLNFLYHLFAKGADLCRDTDGDVFCSTVLAANTIEHTWTLLNVAAQIRLKHA